MDPLPETGPTDFYVQLAGGSRYTVTGAQPVMPGDRTISFDFVSDGGKLGAGGSGTLSVDKEPVAQGRIDRTVPVMFSADEGARCWH